MLLQPEGRPERTPEATEPLEAVLQHPVGVDRRLEVGEVLDSVVHHRLHSGDVGVGYIPLGDGRVTLVPRIRQIALEVIGQAPLTVELGLDVRGDAGNVELPRAEQGEAAVTGILDADDARVAHHVIRSAHDAIQDRPEDGAELNDVTTGQGVRVHDGHVEKRLLLGGTRGRSGRNRNHRSEGEGRGGAGHEAVARALQQRGSLGEEAGAVVLVQRVCVRDLHGLQLEASEGIADQLDGVRLDGVGQRGVGVGDDVGAHFVSSWTLWRRSADCWVYSREFWPNWAQGELSTCPSPKAVAHGSGAQRSF